jgi:uncharacterized protein
MFVIKPFNFWISISVSTSILIIISFFNYPDSIKFANINLKEILIGVGSAVFLYAIFYLGKFVLDNISIFPHHSENISSVYANKGILPGWVIALLLFFPVGFGEEIFWRGYLQRYLSGKFGKWTGFFAMVVLYTAVHICTFNPILLLASFMVGIYWGLIFMWRKNPIAVLVSHMIWDPFIFIILPMN